MTGIAVIAGDRYAPTNYLILLAFIFRPSLCLVGRRELSTLDRQRGLEPLADGRGWAGHRRVVHNPKRRRAEKRGRTLGTTAAPRKRAQDGQLIGAAQGGGDEGAEGRAGGTGLALRGEAGNIRAEFS